MTADSSPPDTQEPRPAAPPPRPERVEISEVGAAKEWRWRWWSRRYVPMLVFVAFFIGIIIPLWYGRAIRHILDGDSRGWVEAIVAGSVFIFAGLLWGYSILSFLRNVTTVRHAPGVLEITHRPYSLLCGGGRWETRAFTNLCIEAIRGRKGDVSYHIMAARSDGEPLELLADSERALIRFLAHELADAMKLPLEESV